MNGLVISFEGLDGVGKTTLLQLLAQHIRSFDLKVDESESTDLRRNRVPLENSGLNIYQQETLMLLYGAQTLGCRPSFEIARNCNYVLLLDRQIDTCLAYAHLLLKVDKREREAFNEFMWQYAPKPDLTFYINLPNSVRLERMKQRGDVIHEEREQVEGEILQKAFADIILRNPSRFRVIDGRGDIQTTLQLIIKLLEEEPKWQRLLSPQTCI